MTGDCGRAWEAISVLADGEGGSLRDHDLGSVSGPGQYAKAKFKFAFAYCVPDARLVVFGGDDEQMRSDLTVCPWWRFPVHLARWLMAHQAAANVPDPQSLDRLLHEARHR